MKPLPGHCLLEIEPLFQEKEGEIFIPGKSRKITGRIGKVVTWTPYPSHPYEMWFKHSSGTKKELVPHPEVFNKGLQGIEGHRFIIDTYRKFELNGKQVAICRLEHLVAEVDDSATMQIVDSGPQRCTTCQSKGELNIMLDSAGYCPSCGKDKHGEFRPGASTPDKYGLPTDTSLSQKDIDTFAPF